MPCNGGACPPDCPAYSQHHAEVIICESCSNAVRRQDVDDGACPLCGKPVVLDAPSKSGAKQGTK